MSDSKIRVLVVDDSPLIRRVFSEGLNSLPDIEVVATAADGQEALELVEKFRPDVISVDLHMPKMDGLELLDRLLATTPIPVVMVSSSTQRSADVTLNALERGAVDYVAKPNGREELNRILTDELPRKIRIASSTDVKRLLAVRQRRKEKRQAQPSGPSVAPRATHAMAPIHPTTMHSAAGFDDFCIAIGISTGGPPALSQLFASLCPPMPPIVIVQHMPDTFTKAFADRLNRLASLRISEAVGGELLEPNSVFIAPGGKHLSVKSSPRGVCTVVRDGPPVAGHKPSADVLMRSVAEAFGSKTLGIIMTGMGRDGVDGCAAIRSAGGYVLGQDAESSDVYGMNRAAFVEGHVDLQVSLDDIPGAMATALRRSKRRATQVATPKPV